MVLCHINNYDMNFIKNFYNKTEIIYNHRVSKLPPPSARPILVSQ